MGPSLGSLSLWTKKRLESESAEQVVPRVRNLCIISHHLVKIPASLLCCNLKAGRLLGIKEKSFMMKAARGATFLLKQHHVKRVHVLAPGMNTHGQLSHQQHSGVSSSPLFNSFPQVLVVISD